MAQIDCARAEGSHLKLLFSFCSTCRVSWTPERFSGKCPREVPTTSKPFSERLQNSQASMETACLISPLGHSGALDLPDLETLRRPLISNDPYARRILRGCACEKNTHLWALSLLPFRPLVRSSLVTLC